MSNEQNQFMPSSEQKQLSYELYRCASVLWKNRVVKVYERHYTVTVELPKRERVQESDIKFLETSGLQYSSFTVEKVPRPDLSKGALYRHKHTNLWTLVFN